MARITECNHYILFIRNDNKSREYPIIDSEYFNDVEDMLNKINTITRERERQGMTFIRHIDYDYIYFI